MGSKNKPGDFDCYANAEPDEPMFVLLGRDPVASATVLFWRAMKMRMRMDGKSKTSDAKLAEALACSKAMEEWSKSKGKDAQDAFDVLREVIVDILGGMDARDARKAKKDAH